MQRQSIKTKQFNSKMTALIRKLKTMKYKDMPLQPLSNVPTNYQLPTLYSFRDIGWTKF